MELSAWQEFVLNRFEADLASGAMWQALTPEPPAPIERTKESLLREIRFDAASRFLATKGGYIPLNNPEARIDISQLPRVLKQALGQTWHKYIGSEITEKAINDIILAVMEGNSFDPRMQIGDWSGKAYPAPSNPSPRLYRDGMWDINTWVEPEYRRETAKETTLGAFQTFLNFCLPRELEQGVLLDWLAWSLQNEARRPNWAIFLFSEEKGTGKSTILDVARALFGETNTARENGLDKLISRFALESLNKKLITVEEVQITSFSKEGNRLKEFITGNKVSVDVKYQAAQTLPMTACFLLTTNHKPLWLEGGEQRYYIIHLTHEGHAQGERSEEFKPLVEDVYAQITNKGQLKSLYDALRKRKVPSDFNPNGLPFAKYASPIMKDLLSEAKVETDEVLEDLFQQFSVIVLPSAEQKQLERYLGIKTQQLRNQLKRIGWTDERVRYEGKQQRVWVKAECEVQSGLINAPELSEALPTAVELGFVWWPVETALWGWNALRDKTLSPNHEADAVNLPIKHQLVANQGPYLDSSRSASYWDTPNGQEQQQTFLLV